MKIPSTLIGLEQVMGKIGHSGRRAAGVRNGLVELVDGTKIWYKDDYYHREDGPAMIEPNGTSYWFFGGVLHRSGGLPAIEHACGSKEWFVDGEPHREDGPGLDYTDGTRQWYLHGEELSLDEYMDALNMSGEEKMVFKLKWGG